MDAGHVPAQVWGGGTVASQGLCRQWGGLPVGQEEVDDGVAAVLVVEEHEEGPVHEPGALLQLHQHGGEGVGVDDVPQLHQVVQRRVPAQRQDVGRQDAPQGAEVALGVGAQGPACQSAGECEACLSAVESGACYRALHRRPPRHGALRLAAALRVQAKAVLAWRLPWPSEPEGP